MWDKEMASIRINGWCRITPTQDPYEDVVNFTVWLERPRRHMLILRQDLEQVLDELICNRGPEETGRRLLRYAASTY